MLGAAARALRGLLDTVGHQTALDEELESYISSMLEDPDPETCVDVLVEVLASAVAEFNSLENEEQIVLVLRLLEQVGRVLGNPEAGTRLQAACYSSHCLYSYRPTTRRPSSTFQ